MRLPRSSTQYFIEARKADNRINIASEKVAMRFSLFLPWVVGLRGDVGELFATFDSVLPCFSEQCSSTFIVLIAVQRRTHRLGPRVGIAATDTGGGQGDMSWGCLGGS